ncbi:MAG: hypothetical protein RRZ24_08840 [Clostridia bacterium]
MDVKSRATFGHWALHYMVSNGGESKKLLCHLRGAQDKSRLYTVFTMSDRTALSSQTAIIMRYNTLPKGTFETVTTDCGKEFACCNST